MNYTPGQIVKNTCSGNCDFEDVIMQCQFMHDEWWYLTNGSWYAESTIGLA